MNRTTKNTLSLCRTPFCELFHTMNGPRVFVRDLYRVYLGEREGQHIWIVDGNAMVRRFYPPFVMGGNDQRYRFNPENDIQIDNRIGAIELEYTIGHELRERKLMRERGWTYNRAHVEGGLAEEKRLRQDDEQKVKELASVVDPKIWPVYRAFYKRERGIDIWFVDGPSVRYKLDGDFCFVGSDIEYDFIPRKQIWLDATMSCEYVHYALVYQLERRRLLAQKDADSYYRALEVQDAEYARMEKLVAEHEARLPSVNLGVRDKGVRAKGVRAHKARRIKPRS